MAYVEYGRKGELGLNKYWELYMVCAECGMEYVDHMHSKAVVVGTARRSGWKVGKRPLCPACSVKHNTPAA